VQVFRAAPYWSINMLKFLQDSRSVQVDGRHRAAPGARAAAAVEAPLDLAQALTLAQWDQSPPAALSTRAAHVAQPATRPAVPAAKRFQMWRCP
jgi:hypothetical protein